MQDHPSARNLGFVFGEHLAFSNQILSIKILLLSYSSTSMYLALPRFVNCLYHFHFHCSLQSKRDYCNSLYYKLPKFQPTHLQHIQNSVARAVVEAPRNSYLTLTSLAKNSSTHWIQAPVNHVQILTNSKPAYLHTLIDVQPPHCTC